MTTLIPWLLSAFFALTAAVGWWKALKIPPRPTAKPVIDDAMWEKVNRDVQAAEPIIGGAHVEASEAEVLGSSAVSASPAQACLSNPEVKRQLRDQAETLAERLFDEMQEEQNQERVTRARRRMDGMESFFSNAVNTYAETFEVEDAVMTELHSIIEESFVRQRELLDQLESGELERGEHWRLRRSAHEESKAAVTELLGEEAARDFRAIIEEEGERARQEKGNGPR